MELKVVVREPSEQEEQLGLDQEAQVCPSPSNTISGRLGSVSGGLGPFFGGF